MIDFSKEHKTLLSRLAKNPNDMEARADLLRCNCLWAEENIKGNKNTWQNANLIHEVLQYGPLLLETGEMSMYDLVYKTCDRIKRTIFSHPRLSVKILELEREALYRIEAETGHELGITEDVQHEISLLGTNIWYADRGEYDKIKDETFETRPGRMDCPLGRGYRRSRSKSIYQITRTPSGHGVLSCLLADVICYFGRRLRYPVA